jgi:hypothetical protein
MPSILLLFAMGFLCGAGPALAQAQLQAQTNHHQMQFDFEVESKQRALLAEGFEVYDPSRLGTGNERKEYHPIEFVILDFGVDTPSVRSFMEALRDEKRTLMDLYGLSSDRYDELAMMAVGILGNESKFFNSPTYILRTYIPDPLVYFVKMLRSQMAGRDQTSTLSKGPTFIKALPAMIEKHYGIHEKEELEIPFNAAVATLGYLAEIYYEFVYKVEYYQMSCVNRENFSDMLLYLYFGGSSYRRDLIHCRVHPDENLYVKNYREHRQQILLLTGPRDL